MRPIYESDADKRRYDRGDPKDIEKVYHIF
jgi:hypothetical protein